jgi:hypothetical protein
MVVSMVKPKWIPGSYAANVSFSELHTTLECRDVKLWPIYGCIRVKPSTLNPERAEPIKVLKVDKWN